jgi:hypothetical protein
MPRESQLKKSKIQPSPRSPPSPQRLSPPPVQKQTEIPKIGLLDTVKQGFAWGIGTSMSRIIVDKIFSSDANLPNVNLPKNANVLDSVSEDLYKKYQDCLENNKENCNLILEKANI